MSLEGSFSTFPFGDLLSWLCDGRRGGTLAVTLEIEERYYRFEEGRIVAYGSDDPVARDLGRLCLQAGLVDDDGMARAVAAQARNQMPLNDVLVAEGLVDAETLDRAVRHHVTETVLALFLWPEGRFNFRSFAEGTPEVEEWIPPEYWLAEPIETREVLLEGMRRLDEWQRIRAVLPSDDTVLRVVGGQDELPILAELARAPRPLTLGELLAARGDHRYEVSEQLLRAHSRGLLAVEAGAPAGSDDAPAEGRGVTVGHLVDSAESMLNLGQVEEAALLVRSALSIDPFRAEARQLLGRIRRAQLDELYGELPREAVPRHRDPAAPAPRSLSPRDRRLLVQVNGRWDVAALTLISGLGELETLRALRRLVRAGVLKLA